MALQYTFFYFFAALAVFSAVMMVTRRNVVHSAVFLITTLIATAGIFLQLQAEFLFVVQVIVYVGGITVLFVFVIMLVNEDIAVRQIPFNRQGLVSGVLALVLAAQFVLAFKVGGKIFNFPAPAVTPPSNTAEVTRSLFQNYMVPFEIASILLLVAMIGAVVMSKRKV